MHGPCFALVFFGSGMCFLTWVLLGVQQHESSKGRRIYLLFLHFFGFRLLSNMDVSMVWAWMPWETSALEHGCCYYGLGMDALVNVCCLEHGCYSGLGMDALVHVCSRTWMPLWFRHGCSGNRMLSENEVLRRQLGCEAGFHSRMLCSRSTGHITETLKKREHLHETPRQHMARDPTSHITS